MLDKKLRVLIIGVVAFLAASYFILYLSTPNEMIAPSDIEDKALEERSEWKELDSKKDEFSVKFPVTPKEISKNQSIQGTDLKALNDLYIAETPNGTVLMIRAITYPKAYQIDTPMKLLKETMEGMLSASKENVLREVKKTTFEDNPALIFSIQNLENRTNVFSILKGNRQYVIIYVAALDYYDDDIYEYFKESFKFKS